MAPKAKSKDTFESPEQQEPAQENAIVEERPSRREIERRAHEIYLERGGVHGRDIDDWLQAECEINGTQANAAAA